MLHYYIKIYPSSFYCIHCSRRKTQTSYSHYDDINTEIKKKKKKKEAIPPRFIANYPKTDINII